MTAVKHHIDIGGTAVAYIDTGAPATPGPTLYLVHGNSASSAAWARMLASPLLARWRLVAPDLPGCGDSGSLSRYSMSGLSAVLADTAVALGCAEGVFVGHSLGGHLLLEAAGRLSGALGFAVLGAAPLGNPPDLARAFQPGPALPLGVRRHLTEEDIATWVAAMMAPAHEAAEEVAVDIRRTDPLFREGIGDSLAAHAHADEAEAARGLAVPLAVLHAEHDGLIEPAYLQGLVLPTLWRGAVQTIEGSRHYAPLEVPAKVAALIAAFVQDLTGSGGAGRRPHS